MSDAISKLVPVQLLFRGVFPGGFFVLAFIIAREGWPKAEKSLTGSNALPTIAAAVFIGVISYTFLRSAIYPLLEWGMTSHIVRVKKKNPNWHSCLISKATCQQLISHWTLGAESTGNNSEGAIIGRHNMAWNDYIHLQYASAFCIALGALFGRSYETCRATPDVTLVILFFVLAGSAIVGDIRRRWVMEQYLHPTCSQQYFNWYDSPSSR